MTWADDLVDRCGARTRLCERAGLARMLGPICIHAPGQTPAPGSRRVVRKCVHQGIRLQIVRADANEERMQWQVPNLKLAVNPKLPTCTGTTYLLHTK